MKIIIHKLISVLLFSLICLSCSSQASKDKISKENIEVEEYKYASMKDGILHLDLDKSRKHPREVKLSEICDSLIYIPLETKKGCLIKFINDVQIDGDDIFVQDRGSLYHFDINGKFLGQLGKAGRGPGEYVCGGFCIDNVNKRVYAIANFRHRIYKFDYNQRLISSKLKSTQVLSRMCFNTKNNSIAASSWYMFWHNKNSHYPMLTEIDCQKNIETTLQSKYFPSNFFVDNSNAKFNTIGSNVYCYEDQIFFQEIANDTVFYKDRNVLNTHIILNNKDFVPPFVSTIDFSSKALKAGGFGKFFYSKVVGESPRYVFCGGYWAIYSFIYDKKRKELICNKIKGTDSPQIVNDFDGVLDFKRSKVRSNRYLATYFQAERLIELAENISANKSIYTQKLGSIRENITEESNPIIVIGRLKK